MEVKITIWGTASSITETLELPDGLSDAEIKEICSEWISQDLQWRWEEITENTS